MLQPIETRGRQLLVLVGPTGSGKSELAIDLAERLDGEIIGCDALQIYRGLDAATAKPTLQQRRGVPHHLIDVVEPQVDFSVAKYVRLAEDRINEIRGRARLPLIVGGSGMYLRGLLRGIVAAPSRDPVLRGRLQRVMKRRGAPSMHRWLERLDPTSANRLSPGDRQRIVRALELALSGAESWSARLRREGSWSSNRERFTNLKIGLEMPREELTPLLDARVERFFRNGLVEEVRHLLARGLSPAANAFKAIGYREVLAAILRDADPNSVIEEVKRNTRRYAKRQRTWFRREPGIVWVNAGNERSRIVEQVQRMWSRGDS